MSKQKQVEYCRLRTLAPITQTKHLERSWEIVRTVRAMRSRLAVFIDRCNVALKKYRVWMKMQEQTIWDDYYDNPVWPPWAVGARFRSVRSIHFDHVCDRLGATDLVNCDPIRGGTQSNGHLISQKFLSILRCMRYDSSTRIFTNITPKFTCDMRLTHLQSYILLEL